MGVSLPSVLGALPEMWSALQRTGVTQVQSPPGAAGKVQSDQSLVVDGAL